MYFYEEGIEITVFHVIHLAWDPSHILYLASVVCAATFLLYLPFRMWKLHISSFRATSAFSWLELGKGVSTLVQFPHLDNDERQIELWNFDVIYSIGTFDRTTDHVCVL
jgi:hypothetical protein